MKFITTILCYSIILGAISDTLAQSTVMHSFITETNQSFFNGVITDGAYLYGTKIDGGDYGKGYVYRTKIRGGEYTVLLNFDGSNMGSGPSGAFVLNNDTLYGIAYMGGAFNYGTIYRVKTDGTGFEKLLDFNGTNGGNTPFSLIISENILYGVSQYGGSYGLIFKINIDGSGYKILHSFNNTDGWSPSCSLTKQGDVLYGTTLRGGINDNGVLFKINTDSTGFTVLKDDFSWEKGHQPGGNLIVINSTIYGTTGQGGSNLAGTIYKIKTDGTAFQVLDNFGVIEGCNPTGLIQHDSMLYGMTVSGGNGSGIIYKVDTTGNNFSTLHRFDKYDGANPCGLLTSSGDTLYGYANGGNFNYGVNFSINIDGSEFTKIKDFISTNDGYDPVGAMVVTSSKCYGLTAKGGIFNQGVLYTINPNGSNYKVIHNLNGDDGADPTGSLTLLNDTLYGMTLMGGSSGQGAIYSYTIKDTSYHKLIDFDGTNGSYPYGKVSVLGSEIFGMTRYGGSDNRGVIFKMKTNGKGFVNLFDFAGTNVTNPYGSIVVLDSMLYGMALNNTSGLLVVFSIHSDGTNFQVLYESNGIDAGQYGTSLITDGTFLYGATQQGGTSDSGVLFKIKTDGTGFEKLLDFNYTIGVNPIDPLLLVDSWLYGSTLIGGSSGLGTVFGIKTDGTGFYNLVDYGAIFLSPTKKVNGYHVKNASSGSTKGFITILDNSLYVIASQTIGDINEGKIFKFSFNATDDKKIPNSFNFKIYPNPAQDYIIVEHEKPLINIKVFNFLGIKVLEQKLTDRVLKINQLPAGIYIISVDNINTPFIKL